MASIDLYTKQQIDAKLPDTTGAATGDVLTFNGSGNAWTAIPDQLPATGTASAGDILTLDSNKDPAWSAAPSSGMAAHTFTTFGEIYAAINAHRDAIIKYRRISSDGTTKEMEGRLSLIDASSANVDWIYMHSSSTALIIEHYLKGFNNGASQTTQNITGYQVRLDSTYTYSGQTGSIAFNASDVILYY